MTRTLRFLVLALCSVVGMTSGFLVRPHPEAGLCVSSPSETSGCPIMTLQMAESDEERLQALGYSEDEIQRSQKDSDPEKMKVRVDLIPDVDSFTLTAIGFALIALNFFVFANMGDGGIGGIVAAFINTVNN